MLYCYYRAVTQLMQWYARYYHIFIVHQINDSDPLRTICARTNAVILEYARMRTQDSHRNVVLEKDPWHIDVTKGYRGVHLLRRYFAEKPEKPLKP